MGNWLNSICLMLLALTAGAVGGGLIGYGHGVDKQRAAHNAQSVIDLTTIINAGNQLINDSNAASKSMRLALSQRAAYDTNTTREINNALAQNAGSRVDCRFDDGVMRNLHQARQRAAATAAVGVRNTMPGPHADTE